MINPFIFRQSWIKFVDKSAAYKRNYILGTLLKIGVEDSSELRFEIGKLDESNLNALCADIDLGIVDFDKLLNSFRLGR